MRRTALIRPQHLPLALLALVYLLAALPLLAPQTLRPSRFAPRLDDPPAERSDAPPAARRPLVGDTSPAQALSALEARAGTPLHVDWNAERGIPEFLSAQASDARLPYTPTAAEVGSPLAIARGFLDQQRALFGIRSVEAELALRRIEPDARLGFAHVRLDQTYAGIPVFGRQLVVHLDADERIVAVNGQFSPNLSLPTAAAISAAQAEAAALANLRAEQLLPFEQARVTITPAPDQTRLMVYIDPAGHATLTWHVRLLTESPLGQWSFFVNARRGTVVHAINGVMPVKRRQTYTARNTTRIPGRLIIDEGERSRDQVAQAAHDGAGIVYDYFFNNFERDAFDGQGSPMVSTVNYGSDPEDAENAAWVGDYQQMIYGDGGRIFKPLPLALDVVAHEFTHGVIDTSSQLIYENQSGALNESYADVFGALIDDKNWTIGEVVIKSPPFPRPYLRSLEDPNARGAYDPRNPLQGVGQPASMSEFARLPNSRRADNGGVHINSGIPNRAHFLLAQAIGREKMGQIAYRTLTQYLTPDSDFADAASASARAAADLFGQAEVDAVRRAFSQVGITSAGAQPSGPVAETPDVPSGGPSAPPPAQALPAGCTDIIVDGGFEGDDAWTQVVRGDTALIDTQLPRSGKRSAWLGGTDQEPLQYLYQDVRLPANATQIALRYARFIHFEVDGLLGVLAGEATFSTVIANTQGDVLDTLEAIPSSEGDDTWREVSFDLSRLAGKTIRLAFASENPRGNVSSFFVDDVALVACTQGSGPAAPPTASNEVVYIQGTISDATTGRGISGAQVFILRPGITASQAAADDNLTPDEVLTFGTTDKSGTYRTEAAIPRNQRYSAIVIARNYRPIIADNEVAIPANAANPFKVDAQLRRSR